MSYVDQKQGPSPVGLASALIVQGAIGAMVVMGLSVATGAIEKPDILDEAVALQMAVLDPRAEDAGRDSRLVRGFELAIGETEIDVAPEAAAPHHRRIEARMHQDPGPVGAAVPGRLQSCRKAKRRS